MADFRVRIGRVRFLNVNLAMERLAAVLFEEGNAIANAGRELVPVNLGILRSSIHAELPRVRVGVTRRIVVNIVAGGRQAPYALFVHEGTLPRIGRSGKYPPLAPLIEWVRRKGLAGPVPRRAGAKAKPATIRARTAARDAHEASIIAIARAIQRKIFLRGTQPIKYLERPFLERVPHIAARLRQALASTPRTEVHQ